MSSGNIKSNSTTKRMDSNRVRLYTGESQRPNGTYSPLPFNGHWYFLELRMPDNDGIVIAGGNSAAELFAVLGFKVFLRCHQNVGRGIKL